MTNLYPDHPNLRGNYAPLRMECNIQAVSYTHLTLPTTEYV